MDSSTLRDPDSAKPTWLGMGIWPLSGGYRKRYRLSCTVHQGSSCKKIRIFSKNHLDHEWFFTGLGIDVYLKLEPWWPDHQFCILVGWWAYFLSTGILKNLRWHFTFSTQGLRTDQGFFRNCWLISLTIPESRFGRGYQEVVSPDLLHASSAL